MLCLTPIDIVLNKNTYNVLYQLHFVINLYANVKIYQPSMISATIGTQYRSKSRRHQVRGTCLFK